MKAILIENQDWTLFILSLVGILGFLSPWSQQFMLLTPLYLLTVAVMLLSSYKVNMRRMLTFMTIASLGFAVEVLGVSTGFPFGTYWYGNVMGPKVWGVPLAIGANWGVLVVAAAGIMKNWRANNFIKGILGATILLGFDLFMEPVAVKYGWWIWENVSVPWTNYAAWWVIAFALIQIEFKWHTKTDRKTLASTVIFSLAMFFTVLTAFSWSTDTWRKILIVAGTFFFMEFVAWFAHKYLMHGPLWFLHRDHHSKTDGFFERNDAFFLIFAIPSWLGLQFGSMAGFNWWFYVGMGILFYGIAYFLVHEIFIHQRFKWFRNSENPYFKTIRRAHKIHHKNTGKHGGVSFGMLVVPWNYFTETKKLG